MHWARQQRDVALRHYRDAHATQPDTRSAVKLATALDAERQTAAAVKLLTGWVAKRQDDAEALRMLADATREEQSLLAAIPYQPNEAWLHTDTRLMPRRRSELKSFW